MTITAWIEIAIFFAVLTVVTPILGAYMARVYSGRATTAQKLLGGVERRTYSLIGVNVEREQDWKATPSRSCCSARPASQSCI